MARQVTGDGQRVQASVFMDKENWSRLRRMALERQEKTGAKCSAADLVNEAVDEWLKRQDANEIPPSA